MIDSGASTFWESYTGEWSMCHAWSCTPTALLSEEVLGIRYDAPTKTVHFAPHPLGLNWVQGIAPLNCGDIQVRWEIDKGVFRAKIASPAPLQVTIPGKDAAEVTINGRKHARRVEGGQFREALPAGSYDISTPT
jgi:hypothetical protein